MALRWHGPRPAVLWEIDGPGVVLRCSGLDPSWSAATARGEALLVEPGTAGTLRGEPTAGGGEGGSSPTHMGEPRRIAGRFVPCLLLKATVAGRPECSRPVNRSPNERAQHEQARQEQDRHEQVRAQISRGRRRGRRPGGDRRLRASAQPDAAAPSGGHDGELGDEREVRSGHDGLGQAAGEQRGHRARRQAQRQCLRVPRLAEQRRHSGQLRGSDLADRQPGLRG